LQLPNVWMGGDTVVCKLREAAASSLHLSPPSSIPNGFRVKLVDVSLDLRKCECVGWLVWLAARVCGVGLLCGTRPHPDRSSDPPAPNSPAAGWTAGSRATWQRPAPLVPPPPPPPHPPHPPHCTCHPPTPTFPLPAAFWAVGLRAYLQQPASSLFYALDAYTVTDTTIQLLSLSPTAPQPAGPPV